jgi:tRNA pseudouridine55 synthase
MLIRSIIRHLLAKNSMNFDFQKGEILLVDKPYRFTSFDVVNVVRNYIRKQTGIRTIKIGHAGTLDPLATGLLILCTGRMTKQIEQFKELDKEYTGTFRLGATTPSYDLEKEIDQTYPWEHITEEDIRIAALSLTGKQEQIPPVFSAIKIKGRRAYKYARQSEDPGIPVKHVHIALFDITAIRMPDVEFRIACSKGTYIRALARDFGKMLNSGAHLTALCRTRIGPYHLRDAYSLEDIKKEIIRMEKIAPSIPGEPPGN